MEILGIVGLLLAIAFLIVGAYRGLNALPLTLIASLIVILTNVMPVWGTFAEKYMAGYAGTYSSYFLLLAFSALYAKVMETARCTTAVAQYLIKWFGRKNVLLVCILIGALLTYGGISTFVVIFALGPIMFTLFREANLPRSLMPAVIYAGAGTFASTTLPGTVQIVNVIPTTYLGTTMLAAPVLGIVASLAMFVLSLVYLQRCANKAVSAGLGYVPAPNIKASMADEDDGRKLPNVVCSFGPIVVLLLIIIVGSKFMSNSTELSVIGMIVAAIVVFLMNMKAFKGVSFKSILGDGLAGGIAAIGGLAAVVGFGTVVQNSDAFGRIVAAVMNMEIPIYFKGIVSTAVIAGITGSASGGLRITMSTLGEYFINSGCNLGVMHRLCTIAACSLDSLPHNSALFLVMGYLGLTHKESYKSVAVVSVIIPAIVVIVATIVCTIAF